MNDYEYFLSTLPDNLRYSRDGYNMYRYWELNGRPKDFEEARQIEMFRLFEDGYHAPTVAFNEDTGIGEFMKPKDHPSVWREVDYYNNGRWLDEKWWIPKDRDVTYDTIMNYNIHQLDPEFDSDEYRDWENLRNDFNLIEKDNTYYYEPTEQKRQLDRLIEYMNSKNADFVNRLKEGSGRKYIQDWEDPNSIATHKLSYTTHRKTGNILVYPVIQTINGELHDFSDPKYKHKRRDEVRSALKNGDYIIMPGPDAEQNAILLTERYKDYYEPFIPENKQGGKLIPRKRYIK